MLRGRRRGRGERGKERKGVERGRKG